MTKAEYSDLLKDPRWQKKRLKIIERDKWSCQLCQATDRTLHVHHTSYRGQIKPWEYPDKLLVTLCEKCHENESNVAGNARVRLFNFLRNSGFLSIEMGLLSLSILILGKRESLAYLMTVADEKMKNEGKTLDYYRRKANGENS
jgi:hypothetical protein